MKADDDDDDDDDDDEPPSAPQLPTFFIPQNRLVRARPPPLTLIGKCRAYGILIHYFHISMFCTFALLEIN